MSEKSKIEFIKCFSKYHTPEFNINEAFCKPILCGECKVTGICKGDVHTGITITADDIIELKQIMPEYFI